MYSLLILKKKKKILIFGCALNVLINSVLLNNCMFTLYLSIFYLKNLLLKIGSILRPNYLNG